MERHRFETILYLLPLICPFFCLPRFTHQSFSPTLTHFMLLPSPLSCPTIISPRASFITSSTCFKSTTHVCLFNIPSQTLPPFALAFAFIYLDRFHLGGNNPLTASFIQMTSSNPSVAVGWINPAHSLPLTEFIIEAQIQSL